MLSNLFSNFFANWKVEIHCCLKNTCFYPGNIVEGVVTIQTQSPIPYTAIRLKFCGKEKVHIQRQGANNNTHHYYATNVILKQLITLAGDLKYNPNAGRKGNYTMPPGRYSYPFAFQLPMNLPPSFHRRITDDTASIYYFVKAYVDIPNGRDAVTKTYFTLIRPMPHAQWVYRNPVTASRQFPVTLCCCIDKGTVSATISMDRTCIAMDRDYLQVFADIDNTRGKEPVESLEVCLRHTLRYVARGVIETNAYIAGRRFIGTPIAAGAKGVLNGVVDLPRNLIPSFATPNVQSSYVITIELNIPWATDPAHTFQVCVGQTVDESNMAPPLTFDGWGGMQFFAGRSACKEYYYQPPLKPVYPFEPVTGWTPPPFGNNESMFVPPPPPPMHSVLPPQSWVRGNPPPESYGQPMNEQIMWQGGYQQPYAPEIRMAPPMAAMPVVGEQVGVRVAPGDTEMLTMPAKSTVNSPNTPAKDTDALSDPLLS